MAKRISEKEIASVRLLALELSEDEITVLASALTSLLQECDDNEFGSSSLLVTWFEREVNHPLTRPYTRVSG
jgi:hypothetical protein